MLKEKIYPLGEFIKNERATIFVMGIVVSILMLLIFGVVVLLKYLYEKALIWGSEIKTWDVVILAALVAGTFSLLLPFISKLLDNFEKKRFFYFEKKVATYEAVVAFIFKYQKREGYVPSFTEEEAQQACFSINQKILLWCSIEVQRKWTQYLHKSWKQDNDSYQCNIMDLFYTITNEIGQKLKRDSFYDCPALYLLYDKSNFTWTIPDKKSI